LFRKNVAKKYEGLFLPAEDEVLSEEDDDVSFGSFYGWYSAISSLANEDITKIEEVTKISLNLALNHLGYLKSLADEKDKQLKKEMAKRR
jgi:hypothetical protein